MSRLFLGIRPPAELAGRLAALRRDDGPGVRWVPAEQLHVTLRFLGDAEADRVAAVVAGAVLPPATAVLGPAVARMGRSVVVVPVRGVDDLAGAVREATAGLGEPPDPRGFRGHLTLARLRHRAACGVAGARVDGSWEVREVELVSSVTDPAGAVHEVIARFPVPSGPRRANA